MNTRQINRSVFVAAMMALTGAVLIPTRAQANLLTNSSFENTTNFVDNTGQDTMTVLAGDSTTMPGWTVLGSSGRSLAWIGPSNPFGLSAQNGSYFLDLTGYEDSPPFEGVSQTIATTAGDTYKLAFFLGSSSQYGTPDGITATAGGSLETFTSTDTGANNWELEMMDFTAIGSTTMISLTGNSGDKYIGLDNVSVDPVPEPSSLRLFLAGLGIIAGAFCLKRMRAMAGKSH